MPLELVDKRLATAVFIDGDLLSHIFTYAALTGQGLRVCRFAITKSGNARTSIDRATRNSRQARLGPITRSNLKAADQP